jgi:hypothetical protein
MRGLPTHRRLIYGPLLSEYLLRSSLGFALYICACRVQSTFWPLRVYSSDLVVLTIGRELLDLRNALVDIMITHEELIVLMTI